MRVGYEIDKVKLYNFMKQNDLNQLELSKMLGKSSNYISNIMRGKANVSEEMLEQIANIMEVDEKEIVATPDSAFLNDIPGRRKRKRTVEDVVEEEPRPTFEQRMEDLIMTDEERRRKFFSSQAFIDEMQKQIGDDMEIVPKNRHESVKEIDGDVVIVNPDDRLKDKIEALTNFLSKAIVNGRKYIGTIDLVNILLDQS